jgi:hypothetical protein
MQKESATKVVNYIIDNRPDDWSELEAIYDADGLYRQKYLATKDEPTTKATANDRDNQ